MAVDRFKGCTSIGEPSITEAIEKNLVQYIDWGFLNLGAYFNIEIPSSGTFGGTRHRLAPAQDPRYTNGQVWQAYRKNWVWESGISADTDPIAISGIFVDGSFIAKGTGYHINYPNGQVVFDTPIATTSTVHLAYSHKWVSVVRSDDVPWLRKVQDRSFRVDDSNFLANSGDWRIPADSRLQLPIVAVEVVERDYKGYQLGGGQYSNPTVILHVIAEQSTMAKRIAAVLADQSESTLYMFDPSTIPYPLTYQGEIASGALCYPDLIQPTGDGGFRYTDRLQNGKLRIAKSTEQDTRELKDGIYHSKVRWNTEVILHKI